jgi:putative DNA primase/helicase
MMSGVVFSHELFTDIRYCDGVEVDDACIRRMRNLIIRATEGNDPGEEQTYRAMLALIDAGAYNEVHDWFNALQWDGVPRLSTWLSKYAGAEDNAYTRGVGELTLVAMVRRAKQPGCKYDYALILEGPQGGGKSTLASILCFREHHFSDRDPVNIPDKELLGALRGKMIVELAEIKSMRAATAEHLKAFISRQFDEGRRAYARTESRQGRSCIFIGTTNDQSYLHDDSGNRRFLPVAVRGKLDLAGLRRDRDQLIAEAVWREQSYGPLTLPAHLWKLAGEEQEMRREISPYEELARGLESPNEIVSKGRDGEYFETLTEVVVKVTNMPKDRVQPAHTRSMGKALRKYGWMLASVRIKGEPRTVWFKPFPDPNDNTPPPGMICPERAVRL